MKCETCDREYDPVCVHAKALTEEIMGYGGHESITDEIIFPMCCKHMRNLMNGVFKSRYPLIPPTIIPTCPL